MKTRKQWIAMLLMLAMLFTALPMAAFAEDEPAPQADGIPVRLFWHEGTQNRGWYNYENEGDDVTLQFIIQATGKNEDGEQKSFQFLFNPETSTIGQKTDMQIGEELKGTIPGKTETVDGKVYLKELTVKGKRYTDVLLGNGVLIIDEDQRIYSGQPQSTGSTGKIETMIKQHMETQTTAKVADGATILDTDRPNMLVHYWIVKSKDGGAPEKVKSTNNGSELTENRLFKEGEVKFIAEPSYQDGSFYRALEQDALQGYGAYRKDSTGKYIEFSLKAEWAGDHKDELDKRYKLDVSGNDLDGWVVTLSNPEKEKPEEPSTPSVPSKDVKIIFDANEGAWANGDTRRVHPCAVGSTITIESAPMREGYKFLYWKGSKYNPGDRYLVEGAHTFVAQWEKDEKKPEEKPSVDFKIKTPRGSALTAEEIAKILAGMKKAVPAIPRAGVGR